VCRLLLQEMRRKTSRLAERIVKTPTAALNSFVASQHKAGNVRIT
jgi:hypothetical protein